MLQLKVGAESFSRMTSLLKVGTCRYNMWKVCLFFTILRVNRDLMLRESYEIFIHPFTFFNKFLTNDVLRKKRKSLQKIVHVLIIFTRSKIFIL